MSENETKGTQEGASVVTMDPKAKIRHPRTKRAPKAKPAPPVFEVIPSKGGRSTSAPLASVTDAVDALIAARENGKLAEGSGVRVKIDGRDRLTYAEAAMVYRQAAHEFERRAYAGSVAIRWCGEGHVKTTDKTARKMPQWGAWTRYKG